MNDVEEKIHTSTGTEITVITDDLSAERKSQIMLMHENNNNPGFIARILSIPQNVIENVIAEAQPPEKSRKERLRELVDMLEQDMRNSRITMQDEMTPGHQQAYAILVRLYKDALSESTGDEDPVIHIEGLIEDVFNPYVQAMLKGSIETLRAFKQALSPHVTDKQVLDNAIKKAVQSLGNQMKSGSLSAINDLYKHYNVPNPNEENS